MSALYNAQTKEWIRDFNVIQNLLSKHQIEISRWEPKYEFTDDATQEEILKAFDHELKPYMAKKGFKTADVINVNKNTPNIQQIRQKFLSEHTHSEDEVRFFIDGEGLFWFNLGGEVLAVQCVKGDFLSVPANYKHWFDLAPKYHVKAIRIFTDAAGWVANYTDSGIDLNYANPLQ